MTANEPQLPPLRQPIDAASIAVMIKKLGWTTSHNPRAETIRVDGGGTTRVVYVSVGYPVERQAFREAALLAEAIRGKGYVVEHEAPSRYMTVQRHIELPAELNDTEIGQVFAAAGRRIDSFSGGLLRARVRDHFDFVYARYSAKTGRITKAWKSPYSNHPKPGLGDLQAEGDLAATVMDWLNEGAQ